MPANRALNPAVIRGGDKVTWVAFNAQQREAALDQRLLAKLLKGVMPWPINTFHDKRYGVGALNLNELGADMETFRQSYNRVFAAMGIEDTMVIHHGDHMIYIAVPDDQINELGVRAQALLSMMKYDAPVR
jgi:hypothetical protein